MQTHSQTSGQRVATLVMTSTNTRALVNKRETRLLRDDRQILEVMEKWHGFELAENPCQERNFDVLQIAKAILRSDFYKKITIVLHC